MKEKLIVVAIALLVGGGGGYAVYHFKSAEPEAPSCSAGVGEICPSDDFRQELKNFKALGDKQRVLSQDPKIKELISVMDQQRGMSERMQQEINQTLQQNPGHQWDGQKQKFVVAPPQPAPALSPIPVPTPAPPKK